MILKKIVRNLLILLAAAILGTVIMCLSFLIPVHWEHKESSYQLLEEEGWYPDVLEQVSRRDEFFHSHRPGVLDLSSEHIMIHTALDEREESLIRRGMLGYYDDVSYPRYWHGYVLPLRLLFWFFDLHALRMLNFLAQFVLVLLLTICFYCIKPILAVIPCISYFFLMPLALGECFQFSSVFYVGIVGSLYIAHKNKAHRKDLSVLFLMLGIATAFLDLLTYPVYALCMPLLTLIVCAEEEQESAGRNILQVISSTAWWILGYAGMWILKPVLGSLFTKENLLEDFMMELSKRSGADLSTWTFANRWQSLLLNLTHYGYSVYLLLLLVIVCYILYRVIAGRKLCPDNRLPAILLIAGISAAYNFVIAEHMSEHHFFTYRNWNTGICALVLFFILLFGTDEKQGLNLKKTVAVLMGILALFFAYVIMGTQRGDIVVSNGAASYEPIELNGETSFSFLPPYERLKELTLCGTSESTEGRLHLAILQNEAPIYETDVEAGKLTNETYVVLDVNLDLDSETEYKVKIFPSGVQGKIYLLVTPDHLLLETGTVQGMQLSGERYPILTLKYVGNNLTRNEKLAEMIVIWLYFMGLIVCAYQFVLNVKKQGK